MGPADPPSLAERILLLAARPSDRDAVVGDLREEYAARAAGGHAQANRWYWMQVAGSLSGLIAERWRTARPPVSTAGILAVLGAYLGIVLLELIVVSPIAEVLAEDSSRARLTSLGVYLVIQPMAVALVAAMTTHLTLIGHRDCLRAVVGRLAALGGLLIVPGIILTALSSNRPGVEVRLSWSAGVVLALVAGAYIGAWSSSKFWGQRKGTE